MPSQSWPGILSLINTGWLIALTIAVSIGFLHKTSSGDDGSAAAAVVGTQYNPSEERIRQLEERLEEMRLLLSKSSEQISAQDSRIASLQKDLEESQGKFGEEVGKVRVDLARQISAVDERMAEADKVTREGVIHAVLQR